MARREAPAPLEQGAVPWLLAAAVTTAAPHLAHLPLWLSAAFGAALFWRSMLWRRRAELPARWLLALLVGVGAAAIGWHYRTLLGRDSGVALIVFFMAMKPLEMRTRRDALAVVMLGFFLLLTHYFYSQSIATGLWLLAATTLLIATLIRLHGGAQAPLAIVRYAGALLLQALPFMLILFVLFPRVSGPLWGLPQDAHSGVTGLSDRMAPGSLSNLIQSGAIAFRVEFIGAPPPKAALYWRGPVFDDYDGLTWRTRPSGGQPAGAPPAIEMRGATYRYVSTLEAHHQRWLLALDLPTTRPADSLLSRRFETLARTPVRQRARYAFTSAPEAIANRQENAAVLRQSLALPPTLNPRSRLLAAGWREKQATPQQISALALRLFAEQDFFYTLQPPLLGENVVDDFLFVSRRGFCEHYASAYVFLMRAAGVPARVVVGYQGGEINPVDGYLSVRQSDAHAWAEIWIAGSGWQRVDPTAAVAPSRIESGIEAALPGSDPLPALLRIDSDWLRALRNRWEAANNHWNQWVLGYNPQRQRELLSAFGMVTPDWRSMTIALTILCALALCAISVAALHRRGGETQAQHAWRRFCVRLARLGMQRAEWEGPLAYAERVARQRPQLAAPCRDAADAFARLQYGRPALDRAEQRQLLQRLKESRRRLPSPWRTRI